MARIRLYRLSVSEAREDGPRSWRTNYYASEAEAEISERAASIAGLSTVLHSVNVPTDPQELADWLTDAKVSA